jgi:hypothetical protein
VPVKKHDFVRERELRECSIWQPRIVNKNKIVRLLRSLQLMSYSNGEILFIFPAPPAFF